MGTWIRVHGTTVGAILIALALTIVFGFLALDSWLGAFYPERLDPSFARMTGAISRTDVSNSVRGGAASNTSGIIGLVMSAVVLLSAIIIVGLVFLRAWAREAAIVVYGILGLVVLAASLGGLAADPPAPSAWTGVLVGLANLSVVGLLLAPASARSDSGRPLNRSLGAV
jgi:hypothetical protein